MPGTKDYDSIYWDNDYWMSGKLHLILVYLDNYSRLIEFVLWIYNMKLDYIVGRNDALNYSSSFDYVDKMIQLVNNKTLYPNIDQVVVAGN